VLLVFCVHAAGNAAAVLLDTDVVRASADAAWSEYLLYWLHRSHHGVYLFFVLSGFLIGRMWWPRPRLAYGTFVWRRVLRVYPAFLLAFAGSLAFAYASHTWQPPDVPRLIANLLFLNGWPDLHVDPFNIVTWSLFYEMTFYLALPMVALVALRAPRPGAWALPIAGIGFPVLATLGGVDPIVLCWSLLFCGVAAALHPEHVARLADRLPGWVVVVAYLTVTTLPAVADVAPTLAIIAFGLVATLVLAKGLRAGNVVSSLLTLGPLVALGRVSYSFYLLHWMIVVLVARAVDPHARTLGVMGGSIVIFVGGFALSFVAASLLWRLAERPYLRHVRDPRAAA
jgi:peptidoglycan/LPS O-acetylase OafA/YrhL